MATASLQLIKRIHNTPQIHMEYIRYITLAWHRLQALLQGQVWVAIKAHFKNNNAESFWSCPSYITCECPLAPHWGRVCCESWHKYSNLWLRKGFTWAKSNQAKPNALHGCHDIWRSAPWRQGLVVWLNCTLKAATISESAAERGEPPSLPTRGVLQLTLQQVVLIYLRTITNTLTCPYGCTRRAAQELSANRSRVWIKEHDDCKCWRWLF